ncbi:MAG: DUF2283 domain-containing protein [Proteobacteria bacterium]|nr:DUF2283 domain-containing protein [Pseudomonadota bacterium]
MIKPIVKTLVQSAKCQQVPVVSMDKDGDSASIKLAETYIVRIRLNDHQIDESNELMAGVIVDVDAKWRAIGFEILDASKRIENPK